MAPAAVASRAMPRRLEVSTPLPTAVLGSMHIEPERRWPLRACRVVPYDLPLRAGGGRLRCLDRDECAVAFLAGALAQGMDANPQHAFARVDSRS
ncbi:hypothetical protein ADK43_30520 [Streptomyces rimosus subsp. rimosus]|nr:hypothetical protein ADK43_30520 [Streptomyces rimosus subsp. rimosus]